MSDADVCPPALPALVSAVKYFNGQTGGTMTSIMARIILLPSFDDRLLSGLSILITIALVYGNPYM